MNFEIISEGEGDIPYSSLTFHGLGHLTWPKKDITCMSSMVCNLNYLRIIMAGLDWCLVFLIWRKIIWGEGSCKQFMFSIHKDIVRWDLGNTRTENWNGAGDGGAQFGKFGKILLVTPSTWLCKLPTCSLTQHVGENVALVASFSPFFNHANDHFTFCVSKQYFDMPSTAKGATG